MQLREWLVAKGRGAVGWLARAVNAHAPDLSRWASGARPIPIERCPAIERATDGAVTRRDLRPHDWREIWPELELVEHLRAQVAELMERLRKYEPNPSPALTSQAPAAIKFESTAEVSHA